MRSLGRQACPSDRTGDTQRNPAGTFLTSNGSGSNPSSNQTGEARSSERLASRFAEPCMHDGVGVY